MPTSEDVARFNAQRIEAPKAHALMPYEKGGAGCRLCIHAEDHPVHAASAAGASNVVMFGRRR